tara:strand:- start:26 stop:310 length:285 start_codon:yes stop_codon:yes gene_type:complete
MKDFDNFLNLLLQEIDKLKIIAEFKKDEELYIIWKSLDKGMKDKEILEGPRILYNKIQTIRNIASFSLGLIKKYIKSQEKQIVKKLKKDNSITH